MNKVTSKLLKPTRYVRTRAPRGKSRAMCDFCYGKFRNKELRITNTIPWKMRMYDRDLNFHQTCYLAYLHITALALFQEINVHGKA